MSLGRHQHGVVSRSQLRQHGVSRFTQRGRLSRGLWVAHLGAVSLRPTASGTAIQDAWAIALQLPPGGAVSGATALDLWCPRAEKLSDLPRLAIVPAAFRPTMTGVRVLRLSNIEPTSVCWRRGVPLRTLGDALMDLFAVLPRARGEALLDHALQLHWIDTDALSALAQLRLRPGRRGARAIRHLLQQATGGSHSEAERRMAALLRKAGIRGWIANYKHRAPGGRVLAELDFAWPHERVCLEIDGWAYHSSRQSFETDRARHVALVADGWDVLRATWAQVTRESNPLIANLRATLAHAARTPVFGRNEQIHSPFLPKSGG